MNAIHGRSKAEDPPRHGQTAASTDSASAESGNSTSATPSRDGFPHSARMKTVEEAGKSFRTVAVFGCAALMFYFCASMVHDLAGKKTAADIGLQFLGTINVSEGLAWAIAAICGGIVFKERRTSRSMAKRLGRMADFERAVDPNRSSSHLTATGTPREEDL